MEMIFSDRMEAGRKLAVLLHKYADRDDVIVLGVPRGGVPVAFEVALALNAPLDVFVLRKLGVPGHEELAFGAIGSGGVRFLDLDTIRQLQLSDRDIEHVTATERRELERRERQYRRNRPPLNVRGLVVIVVDDGIATGASMRAAIQALKEMKPARIVIATPLAPPSACHLLRRDADEVICAEMPERFYGVGQFYEDFSQVSDEEVNELLDRSFQRAAMPAFPRRLHDNGSKTKMAHDKARANGTESEVLIDVGDVLLEGTLSVPDNAAGIVLFAHGSGSSRHSPRNRYVSGVLQSRGIAILLFDLLTPQEEAFDAIAGELRFNIPFLAKRLAAATQWVLHQATLRHLAIGYFGASTGAGAALSAATKLPGVVSAIVSRGGRPDLASHALPILDAPTLLIVGSNDAPVIALNQAAFAKLKADDKKMVLVSGATHLFEEPGTLERVAQLAADWFDRYLLGHHSSVPARSRAKDQRQEV